MVSGLDAGFLLDRQWHWLRVETDGTKRSALLAACRLLADEQVQYAITEGLAVQVHHPDPRTTLDIDIALLSREAIPRSALKSAGFSFGAAFEHSENWKAQDGTPVQFSDDPTLAPAVMAAQVVLLEGVELRVLRIEDLLHEKLRAGSDPGRRRSKRLQDLADVQAFLEIRPDLITVLSADERALLDQLPE